MLISKMPSKQYARSSCRVVFRAATHDIRFATDFVSRLERALSINVSLSINMSLSMHVILATSVLKPDRVPTNSHSSS